MIFWDYIKGLDETGQYYTFVKFPGNVESGNKYKPFFEIYTTGTDNNSSSNDKTSLGSLLTSNDYIELTSQKDAANLVFYLNKGSNTPEYFEFINTTTTSNTIPFKIKLDNNQSTFNGDILIQDKIKLYTNGTIEAKGKCEAQFFNATSDQRAKNTFTHVSTAVSLNWIDNLKICTFIYRDSGSKSIGITTQQIQDKPINDFNFVDNLEATGENGDYMTIKESKLVYVCMSAIQELSQQNKILQEKLAVLEDELKNLRK